jgi:Zn-finger nucleic acid-binding protein
MNCSNCGAAMELIESRRYFRCRHCGTFHFPEPIDAEGIRIVGHPQDAPGCPVCSTRMAHAVLDNDHPIDFCARCRGILLPRTTFATVVNVRRAWAASLPAEPVLLNRQELRRTIACPRCGGRFETYPHSGPGNVVIDACTGCDVIWLDFGEMKQIVDAPGRDRGSQHIPRIDEEYVRRGADISDEQEESTAWRGKKTDPLRFLIETFLDN